jgi:rhodanese-related sulfurtransferase
MNSIPPRQLHDYMHNPALKILLIDVRNRSEFERESIAHPGDALICIEPSVLLREK